MYKIYLIYLNEFQSECMSSQKDMNRKLENTLSELFDKIDHYLYHHRLVNWDDVFKNIKNAYTTNDLDTKHQQSRLALWNWRKVRSSRLQGRTLTDIQYEEINDLMSVLDEIMTNIDEIEDTKAPQADLRTLLRCLQTASVHG